MARRPPRLRRAKTQSSPRLITQPHQASEKSAEANEVLVSHTVRDLVSGSGLHFRDRGVHTLKGVPGEWRLYGVAE